MPSLRSTVVAPVTLVALILPVPTLTDTLGPACWRFFVDSGAAPATPPQFSLLVHTDPSRHTTATAVG